MSEKYRRCDKCGDSSSQNPALILHTFPRAGKADNLTRVRLWAEYCFPNKSFTEEQLKAMHRSHKTLCNKHFDRSAYSNVGMTRLNPNALPGNLLTTSPVPGPSHQSECLDASSLSSSRSTNTDSSTANQKCYPNFPIETVSPGGDDANNDDNEDADCIDLSTDNNDSDDVQFVNKTEHLQGSLVHTDFKCNVCCSEIKGFRYTCLQCLDWDMCAACDACGEHPDHYVLRLPAATTQLNIEPDLAAIKEYINGLLNLKKEHEVFVKEEAVDEVLEPEDDFTDNFTCINDRSIPEVDLHQSSSREDIEVPNIEDDSMISLSNDSQICSQKAYPSSRSISGIRDDKLHAAPSEVHKSITLQTPLEQTNKHIKLYSISAITDNNLQTTPPSVVNKSVTLQTPLDQTNKHIKLYAISGTKNNTLQTATPSVLHSLVQTNKHMNKRANILKPVPKDVPLSKSTCATSHNDVQTATLSEEHKPVTKNLNDYMKLLPKVNKGKIIKVLPMNFMPVSKSTCVKDTTEPSNKKIKLVNLKDNKKIAVQIISVPKCE